ncbi:BnaA02g26780D [Brassica napus]|uniref:BnaA02g26780D protein n=1 Tax=Brassica napus TaxID=3708 RepID=A0A078F8A0_BRANA|nr:BnaA02g26780D [Brassica napus]
MATPSPLPPTVNLWVVLTESKRIINAHSRHLLALSLLFLLPISFSITVYPSISRLIINQSSPSHTTFSLLKSHNDIDPNTVLLLLIAYIVFVTVFNLLSIGSITYTLAAFSLTRVIELIVPGLELYVNWIVAWVVVVVESSYGLTPLKRSGSLVKGMESVSLSMIVVFSIAQSSLVWISNVTASDSENGGKLWTNAVFVVQIAVTSALLTVLMMYNLAGTTVMYMYCKAVQGELAREIAEEFAREYVSLPFDDGKVPHVLSVAYNG